MPHSCGVSVKGTSPVSSISTRARAALGGAATLARAQCVHFTFACSLTDPIGPPGLILSEAVWVAAFRGTCGRAKR